MSLTLSSFLRIYTVCLLFTFIHVFSADVYLQSPEVDTFGTSRLNAPQDVTEDPNPDRISPGTSWTNEPMCTSNSASTQEYCLFTSTTFAGGRGISLLTSPEHAEHLTKLPAFTDSTIHRNLALNQLTNPPFIAKQIKDRGIGLVATRTIMRGEWLTSFTPAYMILTDAVSDLDNYERLRLQNRAFQQLPNRTRTLSENLATQGAEDLMDDIMTTNSFYFPITAGESSDGISETYYTFLFPEIARFNHDCRPSAHYSLDPQTLSLHVIAFRDVFPGEELTITYIDPVQRRKARLRALNRSWGFKCHCSLCTASPEVSEASDARISKILELQEELEEPFLTPDVTPSTAAISERLISLYKQERLWTLMHRPYGTAAVQYNGIGNARKARMYADLALRSGWKCRGPSSSYTEYSNMQALLEDPSSHDSWMYLVSQLISQ